MRSRFLLTLGVAACASCSGGGQPAPAADSAPDAPTLEPPVPLDPVPAVAYPQGLEDTSATHTVRLLLFVDEQGHVVADSTRVAESSGIAELDSAAVAGAPRMRYAPALRDGAPVATAFVQPVEFRRQ